MRCPTLQELPPPPPGKTGWPWTEESKKIAETMPDGSSWPKISIVTPNFNCSHLIEETIRSVLLQGYPDLEYIIIDDGSTDNSVEIINKYRAHLSFFVTRPNKGQGPTINEGFSRATSDIFAWINSDDTYQPDTVAEAAIEMQNFPEIDVISGQCRTLGYPKGDYMLPPSPLRTYVDFLKVGSNWMSERLIVQPESFFRRRAFEAAGGLPELCPRVCDAWLWFKMARLGCKFHSVPKHWANIRLHSGARGFVIEYSYAELCQVAWSYLMKDWDILGDDAKDVADDIFKAMDKLRQTEVKKFDHISGVLENVLRSPSFKVSRLVSRLRR
jgi:glycosyltransferase involved in cell wall biosynthesis